MRTSFTKIHGAGNDFVLMDASPAELTAHDLRDFVARICRPHTGVGADGAVFTWLEKNQRQWRYFNADGSETGVCGNAARSLAFWLSQQDPASDAWTWRGKQGEFRARKLANGWCEVNWPASDRPLLTVPEEILDAATAYNDHGLASVHWIQAGVPQLVLSNHEVWNDTERLAAGPAFRSHASLGTEGANVTWLSLKTMEAVTYERGVEGETLACGSGALAAFLALEDLKRTKNETVNEARFQFPGGPLAVRRDADGALWLSGPVQITFRGQLDQQFPNPL